MASVVAAHVVALERDGLLRLRELAEERQRVGERHLLLAAAVRQRPGHRAVRLDDDVPHVARLPLLQQTTRPYMWRAWFDSLGLKVDRDMAGPRYELFTMLAEAAIQKMGVALIPPFLITKELDSGQLVIPFRHSFRSNDAYQFVVPDSQRGNETLAHFQTWLVDAARRFSDAPAA